MTLSKDAFQRINFLTILAIYLLILIGGIVRNLESGMGCPDWPLCFGQVIPPSSASQLPDDYKSVYKETRIRKNERLSGLVESMGFSELASKMRTDQVYRETEYDLVKAWVEYGNRLVGVLIGFLVVLNGVWSFSNPKFKMRLFGVLAIVLVLFQGWIGSVVVSTNLLPGLITFHMLLAILLVMVLLVQRAGIKEQLLPIAGRNVLTLLMVGFLLQIFMGTWVREQVDGMNAEGYVRGFWIEGLDFWFYIHRSFSILILLGTGYLLYANRQALGAHKNLVTFGILVLIEIAVGAVMAYFSFPKMTQPFHLLIGTVSFGLLFSVFLQTSIPKMSHA